MRLRPSTKLKLFGILVGIPLALIGLWMLSMIRWIAAGEVGVIYSASQGLQNTVHPPRAIIVWPFEQLYTYPTKIQNAVYTQDQNAGEIKAADGILITTSDNANTTFDISVLYRVLPENVPLVFRTYGAIPIEDIQSQHIRRAVRDGASAIGSKYDVFQLMGEKRVEASEALTEELRGRLSSKGITVERAMILGAHPSADLLQKINSRVNSYTALQISQLQNQIAEINRQISVVDAEATQKANALAAAGTQDRSISFLNLDLMEQAIEKWNGELSPLRSDGKQTIVLSDGRLVVPQEQR
ncbi:MAG: hypothetical protein JSS66_12710 [Armatimonadetes bacterium]|nr:hypothetical protein [Armatimonadota bacterium]